MNTTPRMLIAPVFFSAVLLAAGSCFLLPVPEVKFDFLKNGPPSFIHDDFEQNDGDRSTRYYYETGDDTILHHISRDTWGAMNGEWCLRVRGGFSVTAVYPAPGAFYFMWSRDWGDMPFVDVDGIQPSLSARNMTDTGSISELTFLVPAGTHTMTLDGQWFLDDMSTCGAFPLVTALWTPGWLMKAPHGITLDSSDRIYVADTGKYRIHRVNDMIGNGWGPYGSYGSGSGQFREPCGIALDTSGRIYVTDRTLGRLVRVDTMSGSNWVAYTGLSNPTGVFVSGSSGPIHVADTGANRIVRIDDMSGAGLVALGTAGTGVGQFTSPTGIALDSAGRIYISDTGNNRIVRVDDMSGAGWTSYGTGGSGTGQFSSPGGVVLDSRDRLYVADSGNNRVIRISAMSGSEWTVLGYAKGTGPLNRPVDVALDSYGSVYVTNQDGNRIVSFGVP